MNTTRYKEPTEQKEKQRDGLLLDAISLRDYFAAKAMLGVITDPHHDVAEGYDAVASYAYSLADAMLKAREQK